MKKMKVGLIGCGSISGQYLESARTLYSDVYEIAALADIRREVAESRAREYSIPNILTPDELIHDPSIDIVLNLTNPQAHADIICSALDAGKHVYTEKPFGVSREEACQIMDAMKRSGKRVGCAPDSFMGMPAQTAAKAVDAAFELKVVKPDNFASVGQIADHLINRRTVVLNLESTSKETARRIIDFLNGVAYTLDGQIKAVANNTYVITPSHVDISGESLAESKPAASVTQAPDDSGFGGF